MAFNLSDYSTAISLLALGVPLGVSIARGFARMETRFTEISGKFNEITTLMQHHAQDLIRVESDLKADMKLLQATIADTLRDYENRLRRLEDAVRTRNFRDARDD